MRSPSRWVRTRLALVLGGLTAFGPLSIDMYLPAFPEIAERLGTGQAQVQLTLTAFMIGLALGQAVFGPLSDALGRKRPLLAGLVGYALTSVLCAFAPSVFTLVGLRFAQGLAAAAGIVIARAAARDLFDGPAMAHFLSMLMLVAGLGPILAPVIGAQVLRFAEWPGVFVVLACFGLALLVATAFGYRDTLPPDRRRPADPRRVLATYALVATDRSFTAHATAGAFATGAMFAYIAGSPFVLQEVHGLSPQAYSAVFGANALGLVLFAQGNRVLLRWFAPRALLRAGLGLSAVSGTGVLAAALLDLPLPLLLAPLFLVVAGVGVITPNATALAMADHGQRAGTASALLGLAQFLVGGLAAPLVGLGGPGGSVGMGAVIAGMAVAGPLAFALLRPRHPGPDPREPDAAAPPGPAPPPTAAGNVHFGAPAAGGRQFPAKSPD